MAESNSPIHEEPVCATWQRMLEVVLGIFLLGGVALVIRYYPAAQPVDLKKNDLQKQVQQLSREVQQLEQEQAMPALVLHRYRNSICYVFGIYRSDSRAARPSCGHVFPELASLSPMDCSRPIAMSPSPGMKTPNPLC